MKVPQADDIARILDIPLAVAQGNGSAIEIARRYGFDRRQALYYVQATEMLGLIVKRGNRYSLSGLGHTYVALTQPQRKEIMVKRILSLPIVESIIREMISSPLHRLAREQVESLASARTSISGTTVTRRVQSLFSWFTWLADETNVFRVTRDYVGLRIA